MDFGSGDQNSTCLESKPYAQKAIESDKKPSTFECFSDKLSHVLFG
jgi:hypothetical protein